MKIFTYRWPSGYVHILFVSDNWYINHSKNNSDLSHVGDSEGYIKILEATEPRLATTKWWRMKNKLLIEKAYSILQDVARNGPNNYRKRTNVSYEV